MKKLLALILTVVLVLSLAACGGTSTDETTTTAPAGETTTTAPAEETTTADEGGEDIDPTELRYALLLKPLSNEYWTIMKNGVEAWASENGYNIDVYAAESEENLAGQLAQLEDIISKDYAGIAIAPLSPVNLISGILTANERGIPVVNVDESVDLETLQNDGGSMIALVTTDNYLVGQKAGEFIVDQIGSGEVAIIEGTSGNVTSQNRSKGAADFINAAEGCEVVASQPGDWDRIKSLDVATNLIQSNPNLKAFYCANDTMALGVLQAVQNANKQDEIIVVGTDAIAGAKESVAAGELTATVGQDNVGIAIRCLELLMEAVADGWKADPSVKIPTEYIDSFLVTKDNVAQYQ
jgi:D-allose transport system substrate-binding protein